MTRSVLLASLALVGLAAVASAQSASSRGPQCGVFDESHGRVSVVSSGTQFSLPQLTSERRFTGTGPGFGCWVEIGTSDDLRGTFMYGYRVTDPSGESKEFGPAGIEIGGFGSTGGIPVPAYKKPAGVWRVEFYTVRRDNAARAPLGSASFTVVDGPPGPATGKATGGESRGSLFDAPAAPPTVKTSPQGTVATVGSSGALFEDRFASPDANTPGPRWREYTLRRNTVRAEESPWRINNNSLSFEAAGTGEYIEDLVETVDTFPMDNVRVEFEFRGEAATAKGYVGPTVWWSADARNLSGAGNVSTGPPLIGVQATYRWENRGTRGVTINVGGVMKDHPDAIFAGLNEPRFAKHVLTIANGRVTYESAGFPAVTYPLASPPRPDERRHLAFGARVYDAGDVQVLQFRNLKITALGRGGTLATGGGQPLSAGTVVARQSVPASGGRVQVQKPGDPLNGLTIDVPAGAYGNARQFTVSSKPSPIDAATPLITVDNGGGYADTPMTVRIPLKIGPDQFAMGFFYDEGTGKLEGMPLVDEDANGVTVATRHFSSFLVMAALVATLPAEVDTGFRPGTDDWQMVNRGSVIAAGGHCAGQSMSAMWYYYEKKQRGAPPLNGLYDHNAPGFRTHPSAKTPAFWQDDSLAVRLVSTIHEDLVWSSWWRREGMRLAEKGGRDALIYNAFRLSMRVTGEPQFVEVWSYFSKPNETESSYAGHALVAYKVADSRIYVADPNYPGGKDARGRIVDRFIEYSPTAGFRPFEASASAGSPSMTFLNIGYLAKTAAADWASIGRRWDEFSQSFSMLPTEDEKLIGHDRFPKYQLELSTEGFKAGTNQPMADDMTIDQPQVEVRARGAAPLKVSVVQDGRTSVATPRKTFALKPGRNSMGFLVETAAGNWVDYKDYNIWVGEAPAPPVDGTLCQIFAEAAAAGMAATDYYRAERAKGWSDMDKVVCGDCPVNMSDPELLACLKGEPAAAVEPNPCAGFTMADFKNGNRSLAFMKCALKCGGPVSNPDGTPSGPPKSDAAIQACMEGRGLKKQ